MNAARRWLVPSAAALLALGLNLAPAPAAAQQGGLGNPGAPGSSAASAEKKVTLNLKDVPLKNALELLFAGSGLQYAVEPNVPNVPITLNIRDVSLEAALRLVVRYASSVVPGLTLGREGEVFLVRIRQAAPQMPVDMNEPPPDQEATGQELKWDKIPIQFNSVQIFAYAFGGEVLPTEDMFMMGGMGGGMMGGGMMGGGMGGMGGGMGGMGGGMGGMGGGMMGGMGGMGGGMGGMGGGMMGGMGGMGGGMGGMGGGMGGGLGGFGGGGMGGMGGGMGGGGRRF